MPKRNITLVQLPPEKPDCCAICPLCGLIPKHMRPKGSKETHICLGTMEALGGRAINIRASKRDSHHPLRRVCDARWEAFMQIPSRKIGINTTAFLTMRVPYEQGLELTIKFHR